jgi:import inner membrane translocase subunit TIM44
VQGLISDCKLLDIRNVELVAAKILDTDIPVLVISFQTQETLVFRNAQGEIAVGKEVGFGDHLSTSSTLLTKI